MDALAQLFEGKIDFQGQKLADRISKAIAVVTTALAFLVGFFAQSIVLTCEIFAVGTLLIFLVVVPPWSFFNQHPVQWLPAKARVKSE